MKSILILLYCFIILIAINCCSSESLNQNNKIELIEMDSPKLSIKSNSPEIRSKYKVIVVGCIPHFPKFEISVTKFELIDPNNHIILAKPVGEEKAITMKIVYPELAKRAEIEGNVFVEFKVDENENTSELKIIKDIGGGCGDQVINAISKTKFYPGRLLDKNIESRYRIAIQFKIIPINEEEELKLRQLQK